MNLKRIFTLYVCLLTLSTTLWAQVSVEAKLDSMVIFVGQQTGLEVNVTAPKGAKVEFPKFEPSQYITPGVEVLEQTETSTNASDGNEVLSKKYLLTSFDEKAYAIPSLTIKVNGKPYSTNQLALKVLTIDVDTIHPEKFFPPKDVQDNPFLWNEWEPVFWLSFILVLLGLCSISLFD